MPESAFELTTRRTIERDIVESLGVGDSDQVNAKLDIYPYGKERTPISDEAAHEIARIALVGPDVFQMEAS